jgi:hypothetical protein
MLSIQGEFASKAAAQQARSLLAKAGIPEKHMRMWNIIPASERGQSGGDGPARGAVSGGALAGAHGLVIGATLGAAYDDDSNHLPEPSGVRLVVDISPGGPDIESLLREAGAANIHRNLG